MRKRNFTREVAHSVGIPYEKIDHTFESLREKGLIFAKSNDVNTVFTSGEYRLAHKPPFPFSKASSLSFGPFCLSKDTYEELYFIARPELSDDAWKMLIAIRRVQFEKLGSTTIENYSLEASNEVFGVMHSLLEGWDLDNPHVFESLVWIEPTNRAKQFAEELYGKRFRKSDFCWWNVSIDLGKDFKPSLHDAYPEHFGRIPLTLNEWHPYLPNTFFLFLIYLHGELKLGTTNERRSISSSSEFIGLFDEIYKKHLDRPDEGNSYDMDRLVLIKELYDFNSLIYPFDGASSFDFLLQIGFLTVKKRNGQMEYSISKRFRSPDNVLRIPLGWEQRMEEFLRTGSILFAYLNAEEIIG